MSVLRVSHHLSFHFMHGRIWGGWQEAWWTGPAPWPMAPGGRWPSENPCLGPFLFKAGPGG